MDSLLQFDVTNAYVVVFAAVLLDVIGLPLIGVPVLLMAGGLAATGKVSLLVIIAFATVAAAAGDTLWYSIGRYGSPRLMSFLGKGGGKRQDYFLRSIRFAQSYGIGFLLISKFIPGIASLACPAAGVVNMPPTHFLVANGLSRVFWAAVVCWLGYSGMPYPWSLPPGL
jgi:membrane protein DedA with SNARE-associated domain